MPSKPWAPNTAEHDFLLALTEPSLQNEGGALTMINPAFAGTAWSVRRRNRD
jgi:hypothetical protein